MKHIAIVTPSFFPTRGGTEQVIWEWVNRLNKKYRISIITPLIHGSQNHEVLLENVEIFRVKVLNLPVLSHLSRAYGVKKVLRHINKKKPIDIIHLCHVLEMGLGIYLFDPLKKIPIINSLLGWDTYDPITPVRNVYLPYISKIMNRSDYVVTITEHMKQSAIHQGCNKDIIIIPHGTSLTGKSKEINIREKLNIDNDKKMVLSIQRLFPRKGLEYLLKAIANIVVSESDIVFVIGGKGPLELELKSLAHALKIEDYIRFTGFIPDQYLNSYYKQSDLFVLPSIYEGFGLVYIDAIKNGIPIVTTENGGAIDIVNSDIGIRVSIENSDALAEGIKKAFRVGWDSKKIKKYYYQYEWDYIVKKYELLYQNLMNDEKDYSNN